MDAPVPAMPLRNEHQAYWDDIENNIARVQPLSASRALDRVCPDAAAERLALKSRLRDVEEETRQVNRLRARAAAEANVLSREADAMLNLEAKERAPVGSGMWASATALAFSKLAQEECDEVAKPEWWSDEGLKALSARVVRVAPDDAEANRMRAVVLCGRSDAWEAGPRSAAELREAAAHFDRAAALHPAPVVKAKLTEAAAWCRGQLSVGLSAQAVCLQCLAAASAVAVAALLVAASRRGPR